MYNKISLLGPKMLNCDNFVYFFTNDNLKTVIVLITELLLLLGYFSFQPISI